MGARFRSFAAFWYDFVVGDDWVIAAAVVVALVVAWAVTQGGVAGWWVLPAFLVVVLPLSLWRAIRRR